MARVLIVALYFLGIFAIAMDREDQLIPLISDEEPDGKEAHKANSSNFLTDALVESQNGGSQNKSKEEANYRDQIVNRMLVYRDTLNRALGMGLCEYLLYLFDTKKHAHVQGRLLQLNQVLKRMEEVNTLDDLFDEVLLLKGQLASSKSQGGKALLASCVEVGGKISAVLTAKAIDESSLCVICHDNKKCIMTIPCCHVIVCMTCLFSYKVSGADCYICRGKINNYVRVKQLCAGCNKIAPAHLSSCGHYALCEDCLKKIPKPLCPKKCPLTPNDFMKIYY